MGILGILTLWSEIGYFSARLLQNEVSCRIRGTGETHFGLSPRLVLNEVSARLRNFGQTWLADKRVPLIPFR